MDSRKLHLDHLVPCAAVAQTNVLKWGCTRLRLVSHAPVDEKRKAQSKVVKMLLPGIRKTAV